MGHHLCYLPPTPQPVWRQYRPPSPVPTHPWALQGQGAGTGTGTGAGSEGPGGQRVSVAALLPSGQGRQGGGSGQVRRAAALFFPPISKEREQVRHFSPCSLLPGVNGGPGCG